MQRRCTPSRQRPRTRANPQPEHGEVVPEGSWSIYGVHLTPEREFVTKPAAPQLRISCAMCYESRELSGERLGEVEVAGHAGEHLIARDSAAASSLQPASPAGAWSCRGLAPRCSRRRRGRRRSGRRRLGLAFGRVTQSVLPAGTSPSAASPSRLVTWYMLIPDPSAWLKATLYRGCRRAAWAPLDPRRSEGCGGEDVGGDRGALPSEGHERGPRRRRYHPPGRHVPRPRVQPARPDR